MMLPFLPFFISSFSLNRKIALKLIRKIPKAISKYFVLKYLLAIAPITTKITEGNPIFSNNFLSNPFLKSAILLMLMDK